MRSGVIVSLLLWLPSLQATSAGIIITIAGTGDPGFSGDGGGATSAELNTPYSAVVDNDGNNLFVSDLLNGRVRKVSLLKSTPTISTFVGSGYSPTASGTSSNGDGGAATSAIVYPADVAIDTSSNDLYVVDTTANKIRKIDGSTGKISTVVGTGYSSMTGTSFDAGDDGPASSATLLSPFGICLDSYDNIYIADTFVHKIRKVDKNTGIITRFAGIGVDGTSGDGLLATLSFLSQPYGVAVYNGATTSARVLYIADTGSNRVRKVYVKTLFGISSTYIATVAGTGTAGSSGDGGAATSAMLNAPTGVAVDPSGNLFIADTFNNKVRKVVAGVITTIAGTGTVGSSGDGGAATSALLFYPYRISVDVSGAMYIADGLNNKVRVVYGAAATSTYIPTRTPTRAPTGPSAKPTPGPSGTPSTYTFPPFSVPTFTFAPFSIPPVNVPSVTVPPVNVPSVTVPPVSVPSVTVPPVSVPTSPPAAILSPAPTAVPSTTPLSTVPTAAPTRVPTPTPTVEPPTAAPSTLPYQSAAPSTLPSQSAAPSTLPSQSAAPSTLPSGQSAAPSVAPTNPPTAKASSTSPPTAMPSGAGETTLGSGSVSKSTNSIAVGMSVAVVLLGCLLAAYAYYRHAKSEKAYEHWNRWEDRQKRKLDGLPLDDEGFSFKVFLKRISTFGGQPASGGPPAKSRSIDVAELTQNPMHKLRPPVAAQASGPQETRARTSVPFSSQGGDDSDDSSMVMEHGTLYSGAER